jgi:hypothetical protein
MSILITETLIDDVDGQPITDQSQLITITVDGSRKDFRDIASFTAYGEKLSNEQNPVGA